MTAEMEYNLYCRMLAGYVDQGQQDNLKILQRMTAYQFLHILNYDGAQGLKKFIDEQVGLPEVMEHSPVADVKPVPFALGSPSDKMDKLKEDNRALLKANEELRKEVAALQHKFDTVSKDYTFLKKAESAMISDSLDRASHDLDVGRHEQEPQKPQKVPTTGPATPDGWHNRAFERESWPSIHTWLARSDRGSFEYIIGGDNGTWVYHRMSREHSMKEMMMYREDEVAKSLPDLLVSIEKHPGGCGERVSDYAKDKL